MNVRDYDQNQNLLFPPHMRDVLPDDHQAVVVNDIIETMDLSSLYKKLSKEGSQAYHPKMMFKILAYAYANSIFSSRKIHKALLFSHMQKVKNKPWCLLDSADRCMNKIV